MTNSADLGGFPTRVDQCDRAEEEAAEWYAKLCGDSVSEPVCAAYRRWRDASPDNADAYDRIAITLDTVGDYGDAPSILEMRLNALAAQPEVHRSFGQTYKIAAVAASVALVFALTAAFFSDAWPVSNMLDETDQHIVAANEAVPESQEAPIFAVESVQPPQEVLDFRSGYSTRIGQMAEFTLPDGSIIELNTGSEVQVNYTAKRRNLTLVRGEAVFTVAKNANRPFVVAAGDSRVVALGTIFSVRRTDAEAEVTLIEGRVRVDRDGQVAGDKSAQLTPGEQLSIAPNRPFAIRKAELSQVASWRDGRLVFEQMPLREVLEEFNRYSIEKHVLRDESLGDLLVNGTFRIKSSGHFAAALEAGFPVVVRARSGGRVLEVTAAQDAGPVATRSGD